MKKLILFIISIVIINPNGFSQTRYLDDIFTDVTVTPDINYATNISVLPALQGLPPAPEALYCDIYQPANDNITNRPVVILMHTGSFLPKVLNGQATGSRTDSSIVEQCTRWAKKGYVAVAMSNRLGWNPSSQDQNVRTSTLLQASYRGIQDAKAMVRFMRMKEATGNTYGIDPNKIVLGGQGTGGYLSLGYATLDDPNELYLPKFLDLTDPANPVPYVIPQIFGNIDGTDSTFLPIYDTVPGSPTFGQIVAQLPFNLPNHASYSNDINMAFNLGGALADISWLDIGDVPMVSFHCEKDPYAPIDTGDVIVPTTGDFVVEVMGSRTVQTFANLFGNNNVFVQAGLSDSYTIAANQHNGGNEGLYMFKTPPPSSTPNAYGELEEEQSSPWDWWNNVWYDAAWMASPTTPAILQIPGFGPAHSILGNPNMSDSLGKLYIDTVQGYLNPRMYIALNLGGGTNINEVIESSTEIFPNPATDKLNIVSYGVTMKQIDIYSLDGRLIFSKNSNLNEEKLNISSLPSGIYILNIESENYQVKRKFIVK
ncbi:MAG: T9SS type A sorting domain-containing protein [Bacteroidota bacterium]|nr:T9SS type A sorting domain-containing protein [Bacteroidota bacterium]